MKLAALIPLISFIINHTLSINLITKRKRHYIYYSSLLFMISLSCTLLVSFFIWSITNYDTLLTLIRVQTLFWFPLGVFFLNYIYDLIELKRPKFFYVLIFITVIFGGIAAFTSYFIPGIDIQANLPRGLHTKEFILGFTFFVFFPTIYAIYLLIKNMHDIKHKTPVFLRYLFLVSILVLVFTSLFLLYLPFILDTQLTSIGTTIILPVSISIFLTTKYINLNSIDNKSTAKFLFDEITDAIILIDDDFYIVQINPTACKLFKTKEKDALDLHINSLIISNSYSPNHIYFDQKMILNIADQ
ncbi:hypothetical protein DID80_01455 [Candidatus Marinamargulisbacteria bacterium SCGC AAA071-K20]|nr:hypothetical protein DID80_01455 [Candidatus Marinamargulisbacteria bacterium SCGC AAA071-K20]